VRSKSKLVFPLAAVLVAMLVWAPLGSGTPGAASAGTKAERVWVQDNFFDRRSIQVHADQKVVWVWRGMNRHNVRFTKVPDGATRGGSKILTNGKWRRTFHTPGTYRYICRLYTGMRGTVTVKGPPAIDRSRAR
jgi:plastocyanin